MTAYLRRELDTRNAEIRSRDTIIRREWRIDMHEGGCLLITILGNPLHGENPAYSCGLLTEAPAPRGAENAIQIRNQRRILPCRAFEYLEAMVQREFWACSRSPERDESSSIGSVPVASASRIS